MAKSVLGVDFLLGNALTYDRRDDWDSSVHLQIIVLFVLYSQKSPLCSPDSLGENLNGEHQFKVIEEGIWLSQVVHEQNINVSENEVTEDSPVVKIWIIVDLFSQEPVLWFRLVLAEKSPIHVDIPNKAVGGLDKMAGEVCPKNLVIFPFETATFRTWWKKKKYSWWDHAREVLSCVYEVHFLSSVVKFVKALGETPPER